MFKMVSARLIRWRSSWFAVGTGPDGFYPLTQDVAGSFFGARVGGNARRGIHPHASGWMPNAHPFPGPRAIEEPPKSRRRKHEARAEGSVDMGHAIA